MSKPHDTVNFNILGTVNLLELCKKYKVKRFVFASSIYVNSKQGGFTEAVKEQQRTILKNTIKDIILILQF